MAHERRIFIDFDLEFASREAVLVQLSSEDEHYLKNVLRLKAGAVLQLIEKSSGREYEALVVETGSDFRVKILAEHPAKSLNSKVKCLAVALLKGSRLDVVCEYGTELGVETFVFWQAERSISRIDRADVVRRLERWHRIAEAAARQSGRTSLPVVRFASGLQDLLSIVKPSFAAGQLLMCSLAADSSELRSLPPAESGVCMLCGPEGDFSPGEESGLREAGFSAVSLGPLRLRSEVAAITAVAMCNGLWGFGPQTS